MSGTDARSGTQSIERALRLLHLVGATRDQGARLTDLVAAMDLNNPTVRRLLLALVEGGMIEQDPDTRRYFLGSEVHVLGTLASSRFSLQRVALDGIARLAAVSEDTTFLSIARDTYAVCLHREEGSFPIRTHVLQPGDRHPLGVGAGSLAILSALPDESVDEAIGANARVIEERYPRYSPLVLRGLVREARHQGFALNRGLIMPGSWGIGAPITSSAGRVLGALSIAAIESRLGDIRQRELGELLRTEAGRIAARVAEMERPRADRRVTPANDQAGTANARKAKRRP